MALQRPLLPSAILFAAIALFAPDLTHAEDDRWIDAPGHDGWELRDRDDRGRDPTAYDFQVFRITSEISKQVFPLTLDLDDPRFAAGLERLRRISLAIADAQARGGLVGGLQRIGLGLAGAATFVRLYCLPAKPNALPQDVRLAPAW